MSILGALRQKYRSYVPKDRSVIDPETGEIISTLDEHGSEVLDDTPEAPPIGYQRTPSMAEQIRDMVRSERLRQEAEAAGFESWEESEDFDIEDGDFDPSTPYENDFDPDIPELQSAVEEERLSKASKNKSTGVELVPVTEPAKPASSAEPLTK